MQHLCYARIILDGSSPGIAWENRSCETVLICLSGTVEVTVRDERFSLSSRDSVYIPRDSSISLQTRSSADIAEFFAEVEGHYPMKVVRYADIKDDKSPHFTAGGPATTRDLNILIGKNVQAGRLLAGLTISEPGNWTS
jgi:5-deoxy-glucuronate isomerase